MRVRHLRTWCRLHPCPLAEIRSIWGNSPLLQSHQQIPHLRGANRPRAVRGPSPSRPRPPRAARQADRLRHRSLEIPGSSGAPRAARQVALCLEGSAPMDVQSVPLPVSVCFGHAVPVRGCGQPMERDRRQPPFSESADRPGAGPSVELGLKGRLRACMPGLGDWAAWRAAVPKESRY